MSPRPSQEWPPGRRPHGRHGPHGPRGPHGPGGGHGPFRWRSAPPWWPEGEPWPPQGPPWHGGPRRFRRRFALAAFGLLALVVGTGVVIGLVLGPPSDRGGGDGGRGGDGPPIVAMVAGVLVVGGAATALAYRRISRPVGDLLGAAERVATGDYDVRVEPDGPRELRALTTTFNDMATRLAGADEQRRRFLADVTHELRTPLAVLRGGIEAQIDGIHPSDERHLTSLLDEAERLGRLVDDLHTLALADAGRLALHPEALHPRTAVEDAVAGHAPLAERGGVTLSLTVAPPLDDDDVEVGADPVRVRQVLDNLLSNAVRHTPAGGEVHVHLEPLGAARDRDQAAAAAPKQGPPAAAGQGAGARRGGGVRVTVTDSGPGFPADVVGHVFDRRVDRAARPADATGSGLGLSIARELVEAHGGTIAAGNGPSGGARVAFTLPASVRPRP